MGKSGNPTYVSVVMWRVHGFYSVLPGFIDVDFRKKCPSGWIPFNEFCYLFVPHSVGKWEEFPKKCNKENALLAMPKTEKERIFLQGKISSLKHRTKYFYIGLQKKSGAWTWIDDVPYTHDVHVIDKSGTKNCGALSRGGDIKMVKCNEPKAGYVCELRTGNARGYSFKCCS